MREAKKSLVATAAVVAVVVASVVGGLVRGRMEVGPGVVVGGPITMESLVSSTDGIPDPSEAAKDPITESTYFYQLVLLLEREYVDDIIDERALAIGAVRGMVQSLADSDSVFMKPEQMAAFTGRRRGVFEGIGVELKLVFDQAELRKLQNDSIGNGGREDYDVGRLIPTVIVAVVVPGGPADKAGIKVGDRVIRVNDKWALSAEEVQIVRDARAHFDAGEIDAAAFQETMDEWRAKFESAMTPARVADQLLLGKDGNVRVSWRRPDGSIASAQIEKRVTSLSSVSLDGNVLKLRFFEDAPSKLAAIELPNKLVIDLRASAMGDFGVMQKCLALLAPNGDYGTIANEQAGVPPKLTVTGSTAKERDIQLVVDGSTMGAAAVFAEALTTSGVATIQSGKLTERFPWIEVVSLPDGSGYTLRTGTFLGGEEAE